jgi:hypothetical protein
MPNLLIALAWTALIALAALLGWTATVRAQVHRQWANRRRVADGFAALPTAASEWWVAVEPGLGWL